MTNKKLTLSTSNITEDSLMYHIDSYCGSTPQDFSIDVIGYQDNIKINGWVFLKNEKKTLKNIYLRINDNIYKSIYHLNRKDVSTHFNAKTIDNCGFQIEIEAELIPKQLYRFEIIGEDHTGNLHISKSYSVKMIIQNLFVPTGDENFNELHQAIQKKEHEISTLHEIIQAKNRQLFELYNSKTWKINKSISTTLNFIKLSKSLPANNTLSDEPHYDDFLKKRQKTLFTQEQCKVEVSQWKIQPKMSIIVPVYNVDHHLLDKCIQSVMSQIYENWELCIYDDASTNKKTLKCLETWSNKDSRIKVEFGKVNGHISHASNCAITNSTGEYICLLDNDDELTSDALFEVCKAINTNPELDFIYSDEDLIGLSGKFCSPHFKSDMNLELLLCHNYITHFAVIRRTIGDKLSWFRLGYEGSQDHDLFLRIVEITQNVYHIPKVLYHWRQLPTSTSLNYSGKSYADIASRKTLKDYATRNGIKAEIETGPGNGAYRFKREIHTSGTVSIIIPFKDQVSMLSACVDSIIAKAGYEQFEILLVSNNSTEKETFNYLKHIQSVDPRIVVLEFNNPFNYSEINNWAVKKSKGEFILLLNNDIEAISDNWLRAMVEHIQNEKVGIVGAKLIYEDDTIQHAGVIIGIGGVAGHSHRHSPADSNGYYYRPTASQNLSAVTGACLLTKRSVWDKTGGLDENLFKIAFNDIDYCLKARNAGFEVVYTPYAELYHYESKSRGYEDTPEKIERFKQETMRLQEKWSTHFVNDPYYNPNLAKDREDFSLKKI